MNIASQILKNRQNGQTVFTTSEIRQITDISYEASLNAALIYATGRGYLYRITRGIYALDEKYSKEEFANKFRRPSYISLYTVLQKSGVVFQPYSSIFAVTNRSEDVQIEGQKYIYRKIKDDILLNPFGIETVNGVSIATVERAICDKLYLDGIEYFDNIRNIDWKLMEDLNSKVYMNNPVITEFIQTYTFNG